MRPDTLKGRWMQMRGDLKKAWGKLTDDDLDQIDGDIDRLSGKLQEHYGYSKEKAQREIDDFQRKMNNKGAGYKSA